MKTAILLLLLVHGAAGVIHSLQYFYTASSGLPNIPEFVAVGQVDGVEMVRYDSNTRTSQPKQDWMHKVTADYAQYWETDTQTSRGNQEFSKISIEILRQRFNQSGGIHVFQHMYGCQWDDQTGETNGFNQYAYDGEDFITFDLKTLTWIAAKQQALPTKRKWDNYNAGIGAKKQYLTNECVAWLKKYVDYGKSSLLRTERPSMWFLRKTPSSPVSCFATGFFPERAMIFWKKDGEELNEGVDIGEVLPNHDGTFQISADLTLPENATDLHKYECVFSLPGVKEELVYRLDTHSIKTNPRDTTTITITIIIIIITTTIIIIVALILLYSTVMLFKKVKNAMYTTIKLIAPQSTAQQLLTAAPRS